ncbi:RNHCP domain-containing protein [Candidatus Amesbacteria bacterium]|nr:RNHCP domain-containing protein [Candidatus Amesbacteria bacterium]
MKRKDLLRRNEEKIGGFGCSHCKTWVPINELMGTNNRNHCPSCLWSKHLDNRTPGDRTSDCKSGMRPIGLTFKAEGQDRYGHEKQGELMIIHDCQGCHKISINRIAADDDADAIINVFNDSLNMLQAAKLFLASKTIWLLSGDDLSEIYKQLRGEI